MTAAALAELGEVATQADGANMDAGIIATLTLSRTAPFCALEVDELHVPHVSDAVDPEVLVMLNPTRDRSSDMSVRPRRSPSTNAVPEEGWSIAAAMRSDAGAASSAGRVSILPSTLPTPPIPEKYASRAKS